MAGLRSIWLTCTLLVGVMGEILQEPKGGEKGCHPEGECVSVHMRVCVCACVYAYV
jgi:hypothetical protein